MRASEKQSTAGQLLGRDSQSGGTDLHVLGMPTPFPGVGGGGIFPNLLNKPERGGSGTKRAERLSRCSHLPPAGREG